MLRGASVLSEKSPGDDGFPRVTEETVGSIGDEFITDVVEEGEESDGEVAETDETADLEDIHFTMDAPVMTRPKSKSVSAPSSIETRAALMAAADAEETKEAREEQLHEIVRMSIDEGDVSVFDDAIEELDDSDMDYDSSDDGSDSEDEELEDPFADGGDNEKLAAVTGPLMESLNLNPHLKNLLNRMLTKDVGKRATIVEVLQHEWVTDEGVNELDINIGTDEYFNNNLDDMLGLSSGAPQQGSSRGWRTETDTGSNVDMDLEPLTAEEGGKLALIREQQMARKTSGSPLGFGKGSHESSPPKMGGLPADDAKVPKGKLPLTKQLSRKLAQRSSGRKGEKGADGEAPFTPDKTKAGRHSEEEQKGSGWDITDLQMLICDEADANPALMVRAAHASTQGKRKTMEDKHTLIPEAELDLKSTTGAAVASLKDGKRVSKGHKRTSSISSVGASGSGRWQTVGNYVVPPPCALFGVFDGHGGDTTSTKLQARLHTHLLQQPDLQADPPQAMERAFHRMDAELITEFQGQVAAAEKKILEAEEVEGKTGPGKGLGGSLRPTKGHEGTKGVSLKNRSLTRTDDHGDGPSDGVDRSGSTCCLVMVYEAPLTAEQRRQQLQEEAQHAGIVP
jgi:hypothetical protein